MNIILDNIPVGQRIKNIKFEIAFEDGSFETSSANNNVKTVSSVSEASDVEHVEHVEHVANTNIENAERPQKDVPSEMLDAEF